MDIVVACWTDKVFYYLHMREGKRGREERERDREKRRRETENGRKER